MVEQATMTSRLFAAFSFFISILTQAEASIPIPDDALSYVFLQRFPLTGGLFFHTEVLVCPRSQFSSADRTMLDETSASMTDYAELEESWWGPLDKISCVELGYGGAGCTEECCGVPHGTEQTSYRLNERKAVISNIEPDQKKLFLYGGGPFDGEAAYHHVCDHKCWSNWAGTDYNPLTNNCNTFTSAVLSCVFGLSQKKPHLGPSDMVTVKCKCGDEVEIADHSGRSTASMTLWLLLLATPVAIFVGSTIRAWGWVRT